MIATDDSPDGELLSTSHNLDNFSLCIPSTSGLASVVECDLVQEFPPVDYQLPITSPDVFILDHSRSTCLEEGECSSQLEFSTSFGDSEQSSIITDNSHCNLHCVSQY